MEFKGYELKRIDGGVTTPLGFMASGVCAGIKKDGSPDVALVFSEEICSCAGLFTRNRVKGHSLEYCSKNTSDGAARCVVINSGVANACIGQRGYDDAVEVSRICSEELGIVPGEVLTGSTGVIGYPLPMEKMGNGIREACRRLSIKGGSDAAEAIMTTDTIRKESAVEISIGGKHVRIGGMAKGSGMIHPDMATMISVITTDACVTPELLKKILKKTADKSFNRISVDGDTSICDMVLMLANGESGTSIDERDSDSIGLFEAAVEYIGRQLSMMIVSDGEGATKLIEINVRNAMTHESALIAARSIANSPLVKTAFNGCDANWGRILTAAGYSGADFNPDETSISIGGLLLFDKGIAPGFDERKALEILERHEITVDVDFGTGSFSETVWTCDLSRKYIDINAHYRT